MSFRVGDKLVYKAGHNSNGFTPGREYEIVGLDEVMLKVQNDRGEDWYFFMYHITDTYYYGCYFYTIEEIREIRLNNLLD